jgi:methionyl-tRNA formyltransferase
MSILSDIGFLVAPTFRSRAYAQWLVRAGLRPACALMLPGSEPAWEGSREMRVDIRRNGCPETFEPGRPARETLTGAGVPLVEMPVPDINAPQFIEALRTVPQSVILYSGFGAVLLRKDILGCGKRFLHIHGGFAPKYRGSTAFYYSLLKERTIGATALWLEEHIDTGPILARRT